MDVTSSYHNSILLIFEQERSILSEHCATWMKAVLAEGIECSNFQLIYDIINRKEKIIDSKFACHGLNELLRDLLVDDVDSFASVMAICPDEELKDQVVDELTNFINNNNNNEEAGYVPIATKIRDNITNCKHFL